jgi:hypothetical protein
MLPKKLFVVSHEFASAFHVRRAVVIADDEEAALGHLQAHVSELARALRTSGQPCPIYVRARARALLLSDRVLTTPADCAQGVVCIETGPADAVPARKHRESSPGAFPIS